MAFCIKLSIPNKHIWVELIPDKPARIALNSGENPFFETGVFVLGKKTIQYQKLSREWLKQAYPHIKNLALVEGMPAHAMSILVRLFPCEDIRVMVKRFRDGTEFEGLKMEGER